jgi:UDP-glucuronate 4-epimerase
MNSNSLDTILVTGAAGFIGFHLSKRLLEAGMKVRGIDNLNPYYDVNLKLARLAQLSSHRQFSFQKLDLANREDIAQLFQSNKFKAVVNLAAQAGVRYSIENPATYIDSNIVGFANLLEGCRRAELDHLVFASSSSIYGGNCNLPFSVLDSTDQPLSLYAATKKSNELMAYTYSHLYHLPITGLRFFTVYGPWGRPDMAYFKFTKAIIENHPIDVYNYGKMERDFTYIDDIVEGIMRVLFNPPQQDETPYRLYNIGNHKPVKLSTFIEVLERLLGKTAIKNFLPMQPGEVLSTFADIDDLIHDTGFEPNTSLEDGIEQFLKWYQNDYRPASTLPVNSSQHNLIYYI